MTMEVSAYQVITVQRELKNQSNILVVMAPLISCGDELNPLIASSVRLAKFVMVKVSKLLQEIVVEDFIVKKAVLRHNPLMGQMVTYVLQGIIVLKGQLHLEDVLMEHTGITFNTLFQDDNLNHASFFHLGCFKESLG